MRALLGFLALTRAFAALMPMPQTVVPGAGGLKIDSSFAVQARGYSDTRLDRAMRRLVTRVARQTGIEIRGGKTVLWIECRAAGAQYPALGEDESYRMDVSAEDARISAATVSGALRGMETFAQWIDLGRDGFQAREVHIDDAREVSLARIDAGCLAALDADRRGATKSGCHGGREAERFSLAPFRRSGISRGEPALSALAGARLGRSFLYAGRDTARDRVCAGSRDSRDSRVRYARTHHQLAGRDIRNWGAPPALTRSSASGEFFSRS